MEKPEISVIVPIYNVENFLYRCLDSLVNQSLKNLEIICVIDGSPDNSLEICSEYKDKDSRIVIIEQENQGLSGARNTGIANAKGNYIQFCDPDDYFTSDMCEKMYNAITQSNADIAIVGTRVVYDQTNNITGDIEYYRIKNSGLCPVNEAIVRNTDVSAWNKIYKKSIIDSFNIRFPNKLLYEDACFFYKYIFASKTAFFIPERLHVYIRHEQSIMAKTFSKTSKAIDHVKILPNIKEFMYRHNFNRIYEKDIFLWMVISSLEFTFRYGVESIYNSAIKIVSNLLSDIPDSFIQSSPYITTKDKTKLFFAKKNDNVAFTRLAAQEQKKQKLKSIILPFFPEGSLQRNLLGKIYRKLVK